MKTGMIMRMCLCMPMSHAFGKWMLIASVLIGGVGLNRSEAQGVVSLQVFYDELQPYGTWIQHNSYGYVWIPRVERGFIPYGTNGYWIYTEYGNTWVSDYAWGWAPFHYGRWFYDHFHGWIWVPDTVWGPAWVAWRSGGGYYGWAPLMPGFGIHVSINYYSRIPHHYWNFVPYRYITYRHVYRHCVPRTRVVHVIHNTTIVTHNYTDNRRRTYFTGPSRSDMERRSHSRVETYKINNRNRPGQADVDRGTASFYKPDIDDSRESRRSVPSRFMKDDRSVNRSESSRGTSSEFNPDRLPDNINDYRRGVQRDEGNGNVDRDNSQRDSRSLQRYQQSERENQDRSYQNFKQEREAMPREQGTFNQRSFKPVERQNSNQRDQNFQRQREQFKQPVQRMPESSQRTPQRQPQRMQRDENSGRFDNYNSQRERPSINNNNHRNLQPKPQQFRRSSSDQQTNQPVRKGSGVKQGIQRERN